MKKLYHKGKVNSTCHRAHGRAGNWTLIFSFNFYLKCNTYREMCTHHICTSQWLFMWPHSNNLDQHEKDGIVAASLKPPHDLASHNPSSEVTTVLTHSTLDEFRIDFELYVSGIIFFYVWLLFLNIMCVKFIHGDASNRSFPFIAVYFMVEICQNLSVPLLMEVFLLWGYYE